MIEDSLTQETRTNRLIKMLDRNSIIHAHRGFETDSPHKWLQLISVQQCQNENFAPQVGSPLTKADHSYAF